MQILGGSSFSRNSRQEDEGRYVGGSVLLWVAAIAVLLGLNFASWSFCMWVFGQPEHPMNYKILTRLEKLDPIQVFGVTTVPRGKFHTIKELYANVYPFNGVELKAYNGILKRNYLKNYKERDDVTFLAGDFVVESVRQLGETDVFSSGIAVRATAKNFPDGQIDFVIPSNEVPETMYEIGEEITVDESATCAAVLHIERLEDDMMVFTAVPLVKRKFESSGGGMIEVVAPEILQLGTGQWPLSKGKEDLNSEDTELEPVPADNKPVPDGERALPVPVDQPAQGR